MKEILSRYQVIPLATFQTKEECENALLALKEGNLPIIEIALRNDFAWECLSFAAKNYPDFFVGAGTVLNESDAERALSLGAKFLVSPGLSKEVARVAKREKVFYLPGCVTPTELLSAQSEGFDAVKFFPAEIYGGAKGIEALSHPFHKMKFVPTGGISLSTMKEYLSKKCVLAVGGGFVFQGDVKRNLKTISEIVKESKCKE